MLVCSSLQEEPPHQVNSSAGLVRGSDPLVIELPVQRDQDNCHSFSTHVTSSSLYHQESLIWMSPQQQCCSVPFWIMHQTIYLSLGIHFGKMKQLGTFFSESNRNMGHIQNQKSFIVLPVCGTVAVKDTFSSLREAAIQQQLQYIQVSESS